MSILDLMVDLRSAKTEEEFEAAHARFQQRKQTQPTVGEQVTAKLRNSTMSDGKPFLQNDEHADIEGGKVVVKKLN
ncbi:hypothetical protein [Paraburkholderia humisilvae]|uniref:Uncharacterized protein n=1 Tax=Paraburkholderia humisilvae TaxID=627669 RepID=A0A6J5DL05_9BURK|nr:hypothetical protein [Paraburkholderia humisilvae]CAB3754869.1 hypothetical protein LMG29542_02474 [Paraburkholderia humisilvae]